MKILALDIGDRWTGTALSDALGMLARPYTTVASKELSPFLTATILSQRIGTVVVGYPKTMRGTHSEQTIKLLDTVERLKKEFSTVNWVLWDERMTSKQAAELQRQKNKDDKREEHSIAAALILRTYLDYLQHQRESSSNEHN